MTDKQFLTAIILVIILITILIVALVATFICLVKANKIKELSEDEILSKLDDLKKQCEANEYFRVNGVISKEDYNNEKTRIIEEVEELARVINETK